MSYPRDQVWLQEVCPRDGLQNEAVIVPTEDKIRLVNAASQAGFSRIEVSSFVSPKAIPALADAAEVFGGIERVRSVIYVALVPNLKGAERAIAAGADELNMVMSASETHNIANMRMTPEQSLNAFAGIAELAQTEGRLLNGTIATAFGCPFEGPQPKAKLLDILRRYRDLGCTGATLADTTGMANPNQVADLVDAALTEIPSEQLTLHFHNTRGLGLANVLAAYQAGARRFDAALGGLGGCPFAPGASGNIATEDTAAMFREMGVPTALDLGALIAISRSLPTLIGHNIPGQIVKSGLVSDLHPMPEKPALSFRQRDGA